MSNKKAVTLREALKILTPRPLESREEIAALYSEKPNEVRGDDKIAHIKLGLTEADAENPYKAFLIGHSGSGKSTELSRLINDMQDQFRFVRFDVREEIDPVNFKPFDILLLMMIKLVEETSKPVEEGGAGMRPSERLLENIYNWFHNKTVTITKKRSGEVKAEAGIGKPKETWWPKIVEIIASVKGEIKLSADREEKVVNYRLSRIYELVELINAFLAECNELLKTEIDKQWVFIGESFDKPGIPRARIEDLFLNYANILQDLETHLIFNIPLSLVYSEKGAQLPRLSGGTITIPDSPVFHPDHSPHLEGRAAMADILNKRMESDLFESSQQNRLIVASGGNINQLLYLTSAAARYAIIRNAPGPKIGAVDVNRTIADMKKEFEGALGSDPSDEVAVPWEDKASKLMQIYNQEPKARIRNQKLNSLLRARAVQEFNGVWWFGVYPIVVDIMNEQNLITPGVPGKAPGGTE